MTISKTRKQYTTEFKEEALKLASKVGTTKAARELGVYQSQIYGWRSAAQKKATTSKRESGLATENARLRRQLAEQAEELEILKKAAVGSIGHCNRYPKRLICSGLVNETNIYTGRTGSVSPGANDCGVRSVAKWVLRMGETLPESFCAAVDPAGYGRKD